MRKYYCDKCKKETNDLHDISADYNLNYIGEICSDCLKELNLWSKND